MPQGELVLGPDVEYLHITPLHPLQQLRAGDRLHAITILEVVAHDLSDLRDMALSDVGQRCDEIEHGLVGHSVVDEFAAAASLDQSRTPHLPGAGHCSGQTCTIS
jgi:hypothetical protein